MRRPICLLPVLFILSCAGGCTYAPAEPFEFVLDFVHNNPGEPPFETKYNDPEYLKSQGFNGAVTFSHINCAITYDNFDTGLVPEGSDERAWIEAKAKALDIQFDAFEQAGIPVYPFTDFLVFPKSVWEKYGDSITGVGKIEGDGGAGSAERVRKPDLESPLTQALLRAQIDGIFERFPSVDGITLRFGETYLHDTPFHMGGSPIRQDKMVEDHILLINILREEICVKRGRKLFYRTWDFGYNFHNDPKKYLAITNRVEPHPNLIFSVKYQQDDYHRMTPFNPCIGIGKHRQIVESQSSMEAYGKGAHPYYTGKGVIEGWPETVNEIEFGKHCFTGRSNDPSNPRGLRDVSGGGILSGVVTWARGGGWKGPYIKNEIWSDLNNYVVSHWAQNPSKSEDEIFFDFTDSRGFDKKNAALFREIALLSIEAVRKGHCNSFVAQDVWWTRDEYFSAERNIPAVDEIISRGLEKQVLDEKAESVVMWRRIEQLSRDFECGDIELLEAIRTSCTYGRIKYQLIEQMWHLMIIDGRDRAGLAVDREEVLDVVSRYDGLWDEWRCLYDTHPFCATLYTDKCWGGEPAGSIGELFDKWRRGACLTCGTLQ